MAFLLPVLVVLALSVGQVAVVAQARVLVTHSAREGARVAAVGGSDQAVREAVVSRSTLAPERLDVQIIRRVSTVEVLVRYRDPTDVALIGPLIGDVDLMGVAIMRRE